MPITQSECCCARFAQFRVACHRHLVHLLLLLLEQMLLLLEQTRMPYFAALVPCQS
jgi:hypothetical protein